MSVATLECPKCRGAMEQGFMLDNGNHEIPRVGHWIQGAPEKSFWSGLNLKHRKQIPVATFRCVNCGFLESYAQ